uniref:Uncharacterized protein n=1 Tax=Anguilla anguilla TaxID=7936 RepID=A0A0E9V9Z9_ANGAN
MQLLVLNFEAVCTNVIHLVCRFVSKVANVKLSQSTESESVGVFSLDFRYINKISFKHFTDGNTNCLHFFDKCLLGSKPV